MPQDDELLIARAKTGNMEAFEELLGIYEKKIYSVAYAAMGNREDAKDMAQDAIFKIYRHIGSFKGDCTFSVWIHRITLNTCLDELRRRKRRGTFSLEAAMESGRQWEDRAAGPADRAEQSELNRRIHKAITELDEDHRSVIILRDVQGLSYQEIAEVTGMALGTVKSRINRARSQLQEKLKEVMELL